MKITSNSSVLIISHYYKRTLSGGGPPQEVRDFFLPKIKKLCYIEHPFPTASDRKSSMTIYENGIFKKRIFTPSIMGPQTIFYVLDVFITFYFLLLARTKFDLCVALDNLNTASMIPFRKIGLVKKLVFYTIDYAPQRFENKILNSIYHFFDRLACYHADKIWIVSGRMKTGRKKNKVDVKKSAPSIMLPMGANLEKIKILSIDRINRHQIIFAGFLLEKQGVQIILETLPKIIKKIPDIKFIIIGQGEYEEKLKALSNNLALDNHIVFKGYIKEYTKVYKILSESAIGLAPYFPTSSNYTIYADPGKIKLYLGCGLPVVVTDVPKIAKTIQSKKAGLIVDYETNSFANAIVKLLSDDKLYKKYRQNAIKLSKNYNTNTLIKKAFERT